MNDPTNAERQRLYRARRKAEAEGLVEIAVGPDRYWVPETEADKIARIAAESKPRGRPVVSQFEF